MTLPLPVPLLPEYNRDCYNSPPPRLLPRCLFRGVHALFPLRPFAPCLCSMDFTPWVAGNWDL